jgi:hypothetical protein
MVSLPRMGATFSFGSTIDDRKLDIHENEIGPLGFGFVYSGLSIRSLDDSIARAAE